MMRKTYVAPEGTAHQDRRLNARRRKRARSAGRVTAAVVMDVAGIAFTSVFLWLGAGSTVLNGEPIVMMFAFAGGAVLAAQSNLYTARADARVAVSLAVACALTLVVAYALRVTLIETYFYSWILVFGGTYIAAKFGVTLVIDAFAGRAPGALIWRLIAIASGITVILLLGDVWVDNLLLIDLIIFVILLTLAGVLVELGVRSYRASRQIED